MRAPKSPTQNLGHVVGKLVLVVSTLVCLASIGGAMAVAAPVLIPLIWLAARDASGWGRGAWSVLAALAAGEAAWIYAYWIGGDENILLLWMPIAAAALVVVVFNGSLGSVDRAPRENASFPSGFR